jgi:flavin-dependent dehydrogenase
LHLGVGGYAALFNPIIALEKFRGRVAPLFHIESGRWVERRGGEIPVNGVLNKISCEHGLLIGDAAGAVSPLTAGGLDACLRLSALAAHVLAGILNEGDYKLLELYSGRRFRSRFISRRWMRKVLKSVRTPFWADLIIGLLRLPTFRRIARHIFFGRGSFPEVGVELNGELNFLES